MNFREPISDVHHAIAKYVDFNDTGKYFIVAIQGGFKVFAAETCELHSEQHLPWSSTIATMLGETQITGLVRLPDDESDGAQKLVLWDSASRKEAASIQAKAAILRCCLSRTHIILVFKRSVNLYRHQPKIERIASYETSDNAAGLCCLGKNHLVFPGRTAGHLQMVTLRNLEVSIVPAHATALRAMTMSADEEIIASASFNVRHRNFNFEFSSLLIKENRVH